MLQARCEKYNFGRKNRQLSFYSLLHLALWRCATWVSNHTHYVTPSQMLMLLLERYYSFGYFLTLALGETQSALDKSLPLVKVCAKQKIGRLWQNSYHDLHLDTFTANIIKHKFGTRGSFIVYPPGSFDLYIFAELSRPEGTIFSNEVSEIGIDVKFVRVRGGILGFAKLVDVP